MPETALRRHGLTFDQVADAVRRSSLDLPGGSVRAESGEILLPMAISLAYGVLFATFITLLLVPTTYLILEDVGWMGRKLIGRPAPAVATVGQS